MICWRCAGFGLVLDRKEEGYTVYRTCPVCRPREEERSNE